MPSSCGHRTTGAHARHCVYSTQFHHDGQTGFVSGQHPFCCKRRLRAASPHANDARLSFG